MLTTLSAPGEKYLVQHQYSSGWAQDHTAVGVVLHSTTLNRLFTRYQQVITPNVDRFLTQISTDFGPDEQITNPKPSRG
jgi:hypothetical protein